MVGWFTLCCFVFELILVFDFDVLGFAVRSCFVFALRVAAFGVMLCLIRCFVFVLDFDFV